MLEYVLLYPSKDLHMGGGYPCPHGCAEDLVDVCP